MKSYKVVYAGGEGEIIEKKSRFIATVRPVECEEEAAAFIGAIKKQYWDATHNCSAFTIGRNHELTRCSDDGEPSGTAGRCWTCCCGKTFTMQQSSLRGILAARCLEPEGLYVPIKRVRRQGLRRQS